MSLICEKLDAGFENTPVVAGVDLAIAEGNILAIAGPNGAGKSTLLKSLARLLKPIAGHIKLDGQDIWNLPAREFASRVAYVPQSQEFEQDMTVQELVALGRNPHQPWWSWGASAEDRDAVNDALEKTSTTNLRSKYLGNLSGGEKQRALIAMALAQKPQYMLFDEPIAHLDFRHQLELVNLLESLRAQGIGIAVVLHDLNIIAKIADRILLLRKENRQPSATIALGSPEEVLRSDNLKKAFAVNVRQITDTQLDAPIYVTSLLD